APVDAGAGLQAPHRLHVEAAGAEAADALLEGGLVLVQIEVHVLASYRSLGRPRMRSATMLRWIWVVPAAMEIEMACSRPSTWVRLPMPATSSTARPARSKTRSPSRPRRWRTSE